jgi:ankyrin repeat protein
MTALLDKGADINAKNNNGETAFSIAAKENNGYVVDFLLKHGANLK